MANLGDTTAALRRLKERSQAGYPLSGEGFVKASDFGANPGQLRMFVFRPETLPKGAPLVVTLHGCTQHGPAYAVSAGWTALAERADFMVLAPEQSASNNPNCCFNWFSPQDTVRGGGEAASIAAMVAHAIRVHGIDPKQVYVTGLSAGGAMSAVMLASYPDLFAGGAIMAGLPYGVARSVMDALRVMRRAGNESPAMLGRQVRNAAPQTGRRTRLTIWHGDSDHTVHPSNGLAIAEQWANAGGLTAEPTEVVEVGRVRRSIWRDSGGIAVDLNIVKGLGHGVPLATQGAYGLGHTASFMLECGVNSTLEIARFWGLRVSAQRAASTKPNPRPQQQRLKPQHPTKPFGVDLGDQVLKTVEKHIPVEVVDVISKALKAAGLVKQPPPTD